LIKFPQNSPNYFSEFGMGFGYNNSITNRIRSALYVSTLPFEQSTLYDGASNFINKIYKRWITLIHNGHSLSSAASILLSIVARCLNGAESEPSQSLILNYVNEKSSEI